MKQKSIYIIIIAGVIVIPVLLNFILRINLFSNIVIGNSATWLAFWGSFGGAAFGGVITLIVLLGYMDLCFFLVSRPRKRLSVSMPV